jgi:hypothetical protein
VVRVLETKSNVGDETPLEALDWVPGQLLDTRQYMRKSRKGLLANLFEQLSLILEIQIDGGRGILNFVSDPAHGDVFIAVFDEEFPGCVEDLLAQELFLPGLTFFDAQGTP